MYLLIAVVIILLIIGFYFYNKVYKSDDKKNKKDNFIYKYLDGLWIGDDEFCKKAEIEGMMVYIVSTKNENVKKASLIMYANNMVIENKVLHLVFDSDENSDYENIELELKIKSKTKLDNIMPNEQEVILNMVTGKMTWKNDDTNYAVLTKDNLSV